MIPDIICFHCERFDRTSSNMICTSFPNGIPEKFAMGKEEHRKPIDKELVYEERERDG